MIRVHNDTPQGTQTYTVEIDGPDLAALKKEIKDWGTVNPSSPIKHAVTLAKLIVES